MAQLAAVVVVLAGVGGTACSSDDGGGGTLSLPASATYSGIFSDAVNTGTIDLTFAAPVAAVAHPAFSGQIVGAAAPPVTVTVVLRIGPGTVTLTGTVNTDNGEFTVTGGGYTFSGTLQRGVIEGLFDGPNGPGIFSAFSDSAEVTVARFCGFYTTGSEFGGFHMLAVLERGYLAVIVRGGGGDVFPLVGRVRDPDVIDIDFTFQAPDVGTIRANVDGQFYDEDTNGVFEHANGTYQIYVNGQLQLDGGFYADPC
jgi:hypothetical protein